MWKNIFEPKIYKKLKMSIFSSNRAVWSTSDSFNLRAGGAISFQAGIDTDTDAKNFRL